MITKKAHLQRAGQANGAAANGLKARASVLGRRRGGSGASAAGGMVVPAEADALLDSLLVDAQIAVASARAAAAAAESLAAEMKSMRLQRRKAFSAMNRTASRKGRG
jgi:hypothetical protein